MQGPAEQGVSGATGPQVPGRTRGLHQKSMSSAWIRVPVNRDVEPRRPTLMTSSSPSLSTLTATTHQYAKEEEFLELLLSIDREAPSEELFAFLFQLLLENSSAPSTHQRLDFFHLFFELLRRCKLDGRTQASLMHNLVSLCLKSTSVKAHCCCDRNWTYRLLQIYPSFVGSPIEKEIFQLVRILAAFHVSSKELMLVFRAMQGAHTAGQAQPWQTLLGVLQQITLREGPDCYFNFSGINSGLLLPKIGRWPSSGYSILFWMRVESFDDPCSRPNYCPHLFSFLAEDGSGLEVFFMAGRLCVQVKIGKSKRSIQKLDFDFEPRKWYFLALVHTCSFWSKSEVQLFSAGKLVASCAVSYPKIDEPLSKCCVGSNDVIMSECSRVGTTLHENVRPQPFYGQIGQLYVLHDPLTESDIQAVFGLGASMKPKLLQDCAVHTGQRGGVFVVNVKKTFRILLSYSPKAVDGVSFIETSVANRDKDARALAGCRPVATYSLQDALLCCHSIQAIFPLFLQIDLPVRSTLSDEEFDSSSQAALVQVISLVTDLLRSTQEQQMILHCKGARVLGFILEHVSPLCWTPAAVVALEAMLDVVQPMDKLYSEIFLHVMMNFSIWIYTSVDVQKEIIAYLFALMQKRPQYFRALITIQRILDILRLYYWFKPEAHSHAKQPSPVSGGTFNTRPSPSGVRKLRVILLQVTWHLASNGFTQDETHALLRYLVDCTDDEQGIDLLQMILALLERRSDVSENIMKCGGVVPFLYKLRSTNRKVRIWALKIIGKLLQQGNERPKERPLPAGMLEIIKRDLRMFPFGEGTYYALMEILLQNVSAQSVKNPVDRTAEQAIHSPVILDAVFELLATDPDRALTVRVLGDLCALITNCEGNCALLAQQPGWQRSVLAIIVRSDNAVDIFDAAIALFARLLTHCLTVPQGYHVFFRTQVILADLEEGTPEIISRVTREINTILLNQILVENGGALVDAALAQRDVFENVVGWLYFIEQCIFVSAQDGCVSASPNDIHFVFGVHRRADGSWEDFHFSQRLLGLLDTLLVGLDRPAPSEWTPTSPDLARSAVHDALLRLTTRLIMHTLHETDNFLHADSIYKRKNVLKSIQTFVTDHYQEGGAPIMQHLNRFLKRKESLWNGELGTVEGVFQTTLTRLGRVVQYSSARPAHVLYILSFLYCAIRRSYKSYANGAKLILDTWKDIAVRSRTILQPPAGGDAPALADDDDLVAQLLTHFSSQQSSQRQDVKSEHFQRLFSIAVSSVLEEESQLQERVRARTAKYRDAIRQDMKAVEESAPKNQQQFESTCKSYIQGILQDEGARLSKAAIIAKAKFRQVGVRWQTMAREMAREKGPWSTGSPATVHMKLDPTEDPLRRRMKLKPNFKFDPHLDAAKDCGAPLQTGPSTSQPAINQSLDDLKKFCKPVSSIEDTGGSTTDVLDLQSDGESRPSSTRHSQTFPEGNLDVSLSSDRPREQTPERMSEKRSLKEGLDGAPTSTTPSTPTAVPSLLEMSASHPSNMDGVDSVLLTSSDRKAALYSGNADLVLPLSVRPGLLTLTPTKLIFTPDQCSKAGGCTRKTWRLKRLKGIHRRRYLLCNRALEFFMTDNTNFFMNFPPGERSTVFKKIIALNLPSLTDYHTSGLISIAQIQALAPPTPETLLKRSGLTSKWKKRHISNFEYLIQLNTIAGRTYNDLTQYPVFPWVLADYTSSSIDLTNPAVYRDLSKPVGALNPNRLEDFIARYQNFEDDVIPKFHYGTHYSSAGIVLYYLIRLEPFTTHALSLQGGKFDHPNRMFSSIQRTWEGCLNATADVKELIPEFFYFPEFLVNSNDFFFGQGMADVELPPWAKTAEDFISINRDALESEHVSAHLHEWIDLIFGYKQRGQAAVDAHNVFYYLTYEGMVNIDEVTDMQQRRSIEAQIQNFGQTPSQLLRKPHPRRQPLDEPKRARSRDSITIETGLTSTVVKVATGGDHCVCVSSSGVVLVNKLLPPASDGRTVLEPDVSAGTSKQKQIQIFDTTHVASLSATIVLTPDGKALITAGCSECFIRVYSLKDLRTWRNVEAPDIITCMALSADGSTLVTGLKNGLVMTWQVDIARKVPLQLRDSLLGHSACITCAAVSSQLDAVVSGDHDGVLLVHSLRKATYTVSARLTVDRGAHAACVHTVAIGKEGWVASSLKGSSALFLHSINGKLLAEQRTIVHTVWALQASPDGRYVIVAGKGTCLEIRSAADLGPVLVVPVEDGVRTLCFAHDETIICGLLNGRLLQVPPISTLIL